MSDLNDVIQSSFIQYSGAVLQSRALIDVRDGLKPSARQIFYSMLLHKLTSDKPYKKTANAVGMAMADFYIHGDASCEGVIMRAGQKFSMRYPLVDVKGNAGTLMESGNYAAMRYTESRLSSISGLLFADIDKNVIEEWRDNYDNTKQFPSVLPSKGFYNLCNGTSGIGIGMASSVPQFNLKEMNNALIHLLWNPDSSFDEIYCAPDFATGALLLNENEVKESLKKGTGAACKLRAVIEYDATERCLVATQIPYSVFTNTICGELEKCLEAEDNPGIDKFNDLTGKEPLIKIYLAKNANPNKIIKYLYKNTSLQSYYGINMTMLDKGRFPRVFTWKEALQAHLDHEKEVYRRGYEFDLKKLEERLHIIEGLLIAIASINEVIQVIKASPSTAVAAKNLTEKFNLDELQAKAILDIKLARLAHLEVEKLEKEKMEKEAKRDSIKKILEDEVLLKKEIEKGLREVAEKFGDARRTRILNTETEDSEPLEVKQLLINITNKGTLYAKETSSLYTQRRGGVGEKIKLPEGEYICTTTNGSSDDVVLFFTKQGNYYSIKASEIPLNEKTHISSILSISDKEEICKSVLIKKNDKNKKLLIVTANGIIKKSNLEDYNLARKNGTKAIALDENDFIVSVLVADDEKIGFLTEKGHFMLCETKTISTIGRVARGVIGIKLNNGDKVVAAKLVKSTARELISITKNGLIKRTNLSEVQISNRGTKGTRLHSIKDDDILVDFIPYNDAKEVIIVSGKSQTKVKISELQLSSRGAQGTIGIKLTGKNKVIGLLI